MEPYAIENHKKGKACTGFSVTSSICLRRQRLLPNIPKQIWNVHVREWYPDRNTQQVEDMLKSSEARASSSQLGFRDDVKPAIPWTQPSRCSVTSNTEIEYVTRAPIPDSDSSSTNGSDIIPFKDEFRRGYQTYKAMTTKPDRGSPWKCRWFGKQDLPCFLFILTKKRAKGLMHYDDELLFDEEKETYRRTGRSLTGENEDGDPRVVECNQQLRPPRMKPENQRDDSFYGCPGVFVNRSALLGPFVMRVELTSSMK